MMRQDEMSRKEMNFSTKDLIEKIKANRAKHALEYTEAVQGYKVKLRAVLKSKLEELDSSKEMEIPKGSVSVLEPHSYLGEYDQFIDMLEMTQDETTSLSITMFNQLVRDQWSWKHDFEVTNASYRVR
jgi:hypothetical protein